MDQHIQEILNKEVLMSYKGVMDNFFITVFINHTKIYASDYPDLGRKINNVLIELSQNILFYSEDRQKTTDNKSKGIGILTLRDRDNSFHLSAGNIIQKEHAEILVERCNLINQLKREELRKFKREQRGLLNKDKIGANIGLIQAALVSSNSLNIEVNEIDDDHSFFTITTKFDKN